MIIKGIFNRYERWNPVHPTSGAFWGMGIGVGCGVGWGPGFGPEVVGYVGAGCGIGFSVGFTVAGFGIGLPANYLFAAPFNALMAARSVGFQFSKSIEGEVSPRLDSFKQKLVLGEGLHNPFDSMSSLLGRSSNSLCTSLGNFRKRVFRGDDNDPKD